MRVLKGLVVGLFFGLCLTLVSNDAEAKSYKRLKVRFHSVDPGHTLIGGLYYKPRAEGRHPGVVMLHGCGGMLTKSKKLKSRPTFWARWLANQGYAVLLADSFNPRGFRTMCQTLKRPVNPHNERPYDAFGAVKFLQAQMEVQANRVALMGWSNGAMTLLWTIKDKSKQHPDDLKAPIRAAVAFYPGCIRLGRKAYHTEIPTLLQLGLADDWTLPKPCLRLVEKARNNGAPILVDAYPGAFHGFDHPKSRPRTITTRNSNSKTKERKVHVGTNTEARALAIERVREFLELHLKD